MMTGRITVRTGAIYCALSDRRDAWQGAIYCARTTDMITWPLGAHGYAGIRIEEQSRG